MLERLQQSAQAVSGARDAPWPRTIAVVGAMAGCFSFQEMAVLPALPQVQRQLAGANTTQSALLESGFLIVAAVAAPLIGKLGDIRGKKPMLLVTLAVYFIGALGAGLAPNFVALIIFRALQGVGGALMLLSIAISRDVTPGDKLGIAIGWIVASFGAGACLGLGLSGILTKLLSWRYIFFAESVLIVFGASLVVRFLPSPPAQGGDRLDYLGVGLLGAALASLIMGLTEALLIGWPVAGIFLLSLALFATWIRHESRARAPLLDVKVLTSARVLLPNVASALAGYAMFSAFFLVPRFVQAPKHLPEQVAKHVHYGFGAGIADVGLYLLPVGVGLMFAGPSGGLIARRYSGKWPFAGGLALMALASALLAVAHGDRYLMTVWLFLLGAGFGLGVGAGSLFVTQAVDINETGIANAFLSLMRLIAGGIGAQIVAALLSSETIAGTHAPLESAFAIAFGLSAFLALIGCGITLMVPVDKPKETTT